MSTNRLIAPKAAAPASKKGGLEDCAAHGCPLPGVIHLESGSHRCSIHYLASEAGWPKATGVIVNNAELLLLARRAQSAGLPQAADKVAARRLLDAAIARGCVFGDEHRETYKAAGLKFRAAGSLVEQGITALAVAAALTTSPRGAAVIDREAEAFAAMLNSLGAR
jgi:hypothetical protein